jgi:hypothetical protein
MIDKKGFFINLSKRKLKFLIRKEKPIFYNRIVRKFYIEHLKHNNKNI